MKKLGSIRLLNTRLNKQTVPNRTDWTSPDYSFTPIDDPNCKNRFWRRRRVADDDGGGDFSACISAAFASDIEEKPKTTKHSRNSKPVIKLSKKLDSERATSSSLPEFLVSTSRLSQEKWSTIIRSINHLVYGTYFFLFHCYYDLWGYLCVPAIVNVLTSLWRIGWSD